VACQRVAFGTHNEMASGDISGCHLPFGQCITIAVLWCWNILGGPVDEEPGPATSNLVNGAGMFLLRGAARGLSDPACVEGVPR
jgi:hypothetical protein